MRVSGALLLTAVVACYQAPAADPSCEMLCTETCPGDLRCVNGTCVGDGQVCLPTFAQVRAGNGFACALDARDLLWCWGSNAHQQLSADDTATVRYATRVGSQRWDVIALGGHLCGLRDGVLACWGANDRGQITGTIAGDVIEPMTIDAPGGQAWSAVSVGLHETCAIAGGQLYCWGANDRGQLGVGDLIDRGSVTPVISTLADWTTVSTGPDHTCAVSASAGPHCWGGNDHGQLGDGLPSPTPVTTPVAIALPDVRSISVGLSSTCAISGDQLSCWGEAFFGALGDPLTVDPVAGDRAVPTVASGLSGWTSVVSAEQLSCATRGDEVWCWGRTRGGGGLANGVWDSGSSSAPTRYWGQVLTGASELTLGWNSNFDDVDEDGNLSDSGNLDLGCVIVDGAVRCWGDNRFGQLGQGAVTMQPTPQPIAGDHVWTQLAAGAAHTCGIAGDELLCWGSTAWGQANGIVAGTPEVPCGSAPGLACDVLVPTRVEAQPSADGIALGRNHSCAIDGEVVTCWGDNTYYQLSTTVPGPTARPVPGAFVSLFTLGSSGTYGQCGVTTTGETHCWGGYMGAWVAQPQHVAVLDTMSEIGICSIGGYVLAFGCVLDQNQQLSCYGDNRIGQFGNGAVGRCGDGVCNVGESLLACPADCVSDTTTCGNTMCDHGETCTSCAVDCGACPMTRLGRTYEAISVAGSQSSGGFVCGIRPDRQVECWGRNARGAAAVADPTTGLPPPFVTTPHIVESLAGCTAIATASSNACAICEGELYCWGDHRRGAVGSGPITTAPITTPRKVDASLAAGESWAAVVLGNGYGCAHTTAGRGYCWGINTRGALGTGAASANLPVTVQLDPSLGPSPEPEPEL